MSEDFETESDITKALGSEGLFVVPSGVEKILSYNNTNELVKEIISSVDSGETIDEDTVSSLYEQIDKETDDNSEETASEKEEPSTVNTSSPQKQSAEGDIISPEQAYNKIINIKKDKKDARSVINRKDTLDERYPEIYDTVFNREIPDIKPRLDCPTEYEITGDITGRSRSKGDFEDFKSLFGDRHDKMINLLSQRTGSLYKVRDIHKKRHAGETITVAGLVWSKFVSKNDNYFVDLEDPRSNELMRIGWVVDENDRQIKEMFEEIIEDEVIAVRGTLADDGGIIWGDDEVRRGRPPIMFPDVPRKRGKNTPNTPVQAALISDVHVGGEDFYPTYWNQFVDWVRTNPKVKYIFIAGDLVEGIGVYPDQDEELDILDIHDQYAMTGLMFEQFPDDVQIFASVGNHDTVRLAEPQPTLDDKFTKYFPDNVEFVGNPANINVNGVDVLMYHGMSINSIAEVVPGLDAEEPIPIMELMLKKRHLAPIYGKNVRLAPEEEDYLVIEDTPDVLHSGHVHKYGQGEYNGVKIVNTATWLGQTSFQKSKGIVPDVGYWSVLDLSTRDITEKVVEKEEGDE